MLAREVELFLINISWRRITREKPSEKLNAFADEEEMIDEALDDKDHLIAGAVGLRRSLLEVTSTEVNFDDEELHEANSCGLVIW